MDRHSLKNAAKFTRNPLGIIGLLLVLVYGIFLLATSTQAFSETQKIILLCFAVGYPIIIIYILFVLVTKHHEKLYSPLDFENADSFERIVELKFSNLKKDIESEIDDSVATSLKGKVEELEESFRKEVFFLRAAINLDMGLYEKSLDAANESLNIGFSTNAYIWKAMALKRLGRLQEAHSIINECIESGKYDSEYKGTLFYNRACYSCLIGYSRESVFDDLSIAFEASSGLKRIASMDEDFARIGDDPTFKELIVKKDQETHDFPG